MNGSPTRIMNPTCGIQQGDPLSPFLVILMAEELNRLRQDQSSIIEIRGLNLHEGMDKKTHQQFMDDTMLKGHPSIQEARGFKKSLTLFAKASGINVNLDKSQVFFFNSSKVA